MQPSSAHPTARAVLDPRLRDLAAVVCDTDGVLLDSARVHAAAWQRAFDACLREHPPADPRRRRPFDPGDEYRRLVDGRPRLDGAVAFLTARGLHLPLGQPDDLPGSDTAWAVAAAKDREFTALLRQEGVTAWHGSRRLLHALRRAGLPRAAVSASRHAEDLLVAAGLRPLVTAVVDGREAARLDLPGKPDPALFLQAARRLGVAPGEAAVVEDALAGVEAGRRGRFGLVVGVARQDRPTVAEELRHHGAHLVVRDLAELLTGTGT